MAAPDPTQTPAEFRDAVGGLSAAQLRRGVELTELPGPARLAPWTHAVSVLLGGPDGEELASGRLILLHDPAGVDAWHGTLRVVVFATCEVEDEMATDPLLSEVAWSWLTELLGAAQVRFTALGGTVTCTSSTRFGDIAGPPRTQELELRASWTALDSDTGPHLGAFSEFLATAAGLPPEGVSTISDGSHPFAARMP